VHARKRGVESFGKREKMSREELLFNHVSVQAAIDCEHG
jgi:hypothetical protein